MSDNQVKYLCHTLQRWLPQLIFKRLVVDVFLYHYKKLPMKMMSFLLFFQLISFTSLQLFISSPALFLFFVWLFSFISLKVPLPDVQGLIIWPLFCSIIMSKYWRLIFCLWFCFMDAANVKEKVKINPPAQNQFMVAFCYWIFEFSSLFIIIISTIFYFSLKKYYMSKTEVKNEEKR